MLVIKKAKNTIAILAIACSLCYAILYYVTSTWYDEANLKNGYVLTYRYRARERNQHKWREWYLIQHRPFYFSSDSRPVLIDIITSVDYSKEWVFIQADSDRYWILDKSSAFLPYDDEEIEQRRLEHEEGYMSYSDNVIGPIDSLSYYHFIDSVGFVRDDKCHWSVKE